MNEDPLDHYHYANDLVRDGRYADAILHYERAISLDPENLDAEVYVFPSWLLSTCPDAHLRNGDRAVEYAIKACEISDWEPWPLTALAAAYAENGEFEKAVDAQIRANELYREYTHLDSEHHDKCQSRLAHYQNRQTIDYDPDP